MKIKCLQVGPIGTNCYLSATRMPRPAPSLIRRGWGADRRRSGGNRLCALRHPADPRPLRPHRRCGRAPAKWPETPVYLNRRDVYADACTQQLFPLLSGDVRDYDEGDTVAVGGLTVTVLATPGHSEGSVTLRCQDALFCGDTLFAGSCGRTDFPGGSMEKMMASLRRLGQLEGDLRVLPGHMEASTLDRERRWNPYLLQAMQ